MTNSPPLTQWFSAHECIPMAEGVLQTTADPTADADKLRIYYRWWSPETGWCVRADSPRAAAADRTPSQWPPEYFRGLAVKAPQQ